MANKSTITIERINGFIVIRSYVPLYGELRLMYHSLSYTESQALKAYHSALRLW